MVHYLSTPLFSIQEAVKSETSLQDPIEIHQDPVETASDRYWKVVDAFKASEIQYRNELKSLYEIVCSFDPVYNNYFDRSYDDITDEVVEERKAKNHRLRQAIKTIAHRHRSLFEILHDQDIKSAAINIAEWALNIDQYYKQYMSLYRLDMNQSKTEIKLRRRPLVRLGHLNNFLWSLKELVLHLDESQHIADLNSNLEISLHKLKNCLAQLRQLNDDETRKNDDDIKISECKDLFNLKPISVTTCNEDFNLTPYHCKLFYFNKNQKVSMNFSNIEAYFFKNVKIEQLCLVSIDEYGKSLLFSPIKKTELKFSRKIDANTIQFDAYDDSVQLFFTRDENTTDTFFNELIQLFPKKQEFVLQAPLNGLGIYSSSLKNEQPSVDINSVKTSLITREVPAYSKNLNSVIICPKNNISSSNLCKSNSSKRIDGTELAKRFMQEMLENEDSSDEDLGSSDGISIVSMEKLPIHEDANTVDVNKNKLINDAKVAINSVSSIQIPPRKETFISCDKESIISSNNSESGNSDNASTVSSLSKPAKSRSFRSIFNSVFKKEGNNSSASLILEQASSLSLPKKSNELEIATLLSDPTKCSYITLPSAKLSIWKNNSWTENVERTIKLVKIKADERYLAIYQNIKKEYPDLLLKLNQSTKCHMFALDLHLKTTNHADIPIMILLRTPSAQSQITLKNAIEDIHFQLPLSNSSSMLSVNKANAFGIKDIKNVISNSSSWRSLKSDYTTITNEPEQVSWTGVGSACILNDGKMKKCSRCAITITAEPDDLCVELTGYEFGKIDLRLAKNQISKYTSNEGTKVLMSVKSTKYILSFDSYESLNGFYDCV